jgi:DNA-binding response OmpR family regulator
MEFSLLFYLAENRNRSVSRSELLDKVWGFEAEVETRATDDTVKRLRKKLDYAGSLLKIETVWGYGFKLVSEERL